MRSGAMIRATIYVDGVAYSGIDYEADDTRQISPAFRREFHNNLASGRDALVWGGEPHVCEGYRNLASDLERVLRAVECGDVEARTITISVQEGVQ